jgi:hypothetical protein
MSSVSCPGTTAAWEFLVVQKTSQFSAAARVLQLAQRLGLDLADALAGDRELLADFLQRVSACAARAPRAA